MVHELFNSKIEVKSMKNRYWILLYLVIGGAAFWVPDIVYHLMNTDELSKRDIGVLTILLPVILLACYAIVLHLRGRQSEGPSIAFFMFIGVWLLGPLCMGISATFGGAGFYTGEAAWFSMLLGIIPIYTFIMSAYDGSVLGLFIATCMIVGAHLMYELNHHWIIPPSVKQLKRRLERH